MNITIVGGGFGGVKTALKLAKNPKNTITLISSSTQFQYYPTLYSTATGHSHKESWVSLRKIFVGKPNVRLVQDTIEKLDSASKKIYGEDGTAYHYDRLVLALGSVTTYFGIEGLDTYAFGIKSEAEIRKLQKHIFDDMSDGREDEKNYVIIGGGPTGVELAGALGEYVRVLRGHFGIKKKTLRINLIEAAPRLLPRLSETTSSAALQQLKKLGVRVETNKKVERQTADSLFVNGKPLSTTTVIWTSGVANPSFYKNNEKEFTINERGKVVVDKHMLAAPHVYVIGDNAATPYAGLAQTALHDAQYVAKHITGKTRAPYKAVLPACVVPIGHRWAVFEWRNIKFSGWLGALMLNLSHVIGYTDVFPLGVALSTWRAGSKKELRIPDEIAS